MTKQIEITELNNDQALDIIDRLFNTAGEDLELTYTTRKGNQESFTVNAAPLSVGDLTNERIAELDTLLGHMGAKVKGYDFRIEGIQGVISRLDSISTETPDVRDERAVEALSGIGQLLDMPAETLNTINEIRTTVEMGTSEEAMKLPELIVSPNDKQLEAIGDLISWKLDVEDVQARVKEARAAGKSTSEIVDIKKDLSGNTDQIVSSEITQELIAPLFEGQPAAKEAFGMNYSR